MLGVQSNISTSSMLEGGKIKSACYHLFIILDSLTKEMIDNLENGTKQLLLFPLFAIQDA